MSRCITTSKYCVNCGKEANDVFYGVWLCDDCKEKVTVKQMVGIGINNFKYDAITGKKKRGIK